jgi:hypothetical protein
VSTIEHRRLGASGFSVPVGTATFGGGNDFFRAWGDTDPSWHQAGFAERNPSPV